MWRWLWLALLLTPMARAANIAYTGFCTKGATTATVQGLQSTNYLQSAYKSCTVTVYVSGTTTPSTLYSDNGITPLANPFTAGTDGRFQFYTATATVDVTMTGGSPSPGISPPYTISAIPLASGGGGSGVTSFNTRTGAVVLIQPDVTSAYGTQAAHVICAVGPTTGVATTTCRQMSLDEFTPGFLITSFSGGSIVEIGATVTNPSFTATYSTTPISAQITNTDSIDSPLVLSTPFTSGTVVGAFRKTTTTSTMFTLTAVGTSTPPVATQVITWEPRTFGGIGSGGASASVTASGNNAVLSTGDTINNAGLNNQVTYGPFTPNSQKIYILMIGGSHTFIDANTGFAIPFNTPTAVSFINQNGVSVSMFLYETTSTLGNGSIQFLPKVTS